MGGIAWVQASKFCLARKSQNRRATIEIVHWGLPGNGDGQLPTDASDSMLIGYARVSATHQNLDRQLSMLKAEGCGRIFKEKLSGREGVSRPQLDKAIEALETGDVLVLAEWDRVTRSMLDGIKKKEEGALTRSPRSMAKP